MNQLFGRRKILFPDLWDTLHRVQEWQIDFLNTLPARLMYMSSSTPAWQCLDTIQAPHFKHLADPCCLCCSQNILLILLPQKSMTLGSLVLCSPVS